MDLKQYLEERAWALIGLMDWSVSRDEFETLVDFLGAVYYTGTTREKVEEEVARDI